jgi:RNA-binding protein
VSLSGKQRRYLRGLAHNQKAIVQVGKDGITDEVTRALDQALFDHELVKVKLGQNALVDRDQAAAELAERSGSEVAQVLGSTVVLYRRHPEDPRIRLPPDPSP